MHHGIVTTPPLAETYTRPGHRVPQRVIIYCLKQKCKQNTRMSRTDLTASLILLN
jgi:hypothetical protein